MQSVSGSTPRAGRAFLWRVAGFALRAQRCIGGVRYALGDRLWGSYCNDGTIAGVVETILSRPRDPFGSGNLRPGRLSKDSRCKSSRRSTPVPCVGGSAGHILVGAFFSCASSLSDARPVDSIEWTLMGEESAPANSGTAA